MWAVVSKYLVTTPGWFSSERQVDASPVPLAVDDAPPAQTRPNTSILVGQDPGSGNATVTRSYCSGAGRDRNLGDYAQPWFSTATGTEGT